MSDRIEITFTGGGRIGDTVAVEVDSSVLVGRSHSAAIRLKDPDVSGRHLEIVRTASGCAARNLSRFGSKVDGRRLGEGDEAPLRKGSVVEIGSRERFRVDSLPDGAARQEDAAGGETAATVFAAVNHLRVTG